MKTFRIGLVSALAVALSLSMGAAFAQTTPAPAPVAKTMKAAKPVMTADQKAAVSKACSAAADKQNLHGKARHKFRNECKDHGGPAN